MRTAIASVAMAVLSCARTSAPSAPVARAAGDFAECVRDVCPRRAAELPRPPGHVELVERDLDQRIAPLLNDLVGRATSARGLTELFDLFPAIDFGDVALDDDQRIVLNLNYVRDAAGLLEFTGKIDSDASGRRVVDRARVLAQLRRSPRFPDADDALIDNVEALVNSNGYRIASVAEHVPLSWLFRQQKRDYPGFLRAVFDDLERGAKVVAAKYPAVTPPAPALIARFESGGEITDEDSRPLLGEIARFALLEEALVTPARREALLRLQRDYPAVARRAHAALLEGRRTAATPRAIESLCLDRHRETLRSFPTEAEIQRFDRLERAPTQGLAERILRRRGLVASAERVAGARIHYPSAYPRARDQMIETLRSTITARREREARYLKLADDVRRGEPHAKATVLALFAGDEIAYPSELEGVHDACEDTRPEPTRDATYATEITVSWQLILREVSARTLAHEMGHVAYFAYDEASWPDVLRGQVACLKRRHRGLEARDPEHYVIEDYADLFASKVVSESGDRRPALLCDGLGLGAGLSQAEWNADTHSAPLFRALTAIPGDLPPRCEAAARAAPGLGERCW